MFDFLKRKKTKSQETETETQPDTELEAKPKTEVEPKPEAKTEAKPEIEAETKPEAEVDDKTETSPKPKIEQNTRTKIETNQGFFKRLRQGLQKTRSNLGDGLANLVMGKKQIDKDLLQDIEDQLLLADIGVEACQQIINDLTKRVSRKEINNPESLIMALQTELTSILDGFDIPLVVDTAIKPYVILVVGVNGVGKTTTIGKLAKRLQQQGKTVMLAAGDTFRAAAIDQLKVWGERNEIPVIAQQPGADSASVVYDALQAAQSRNIDVLIADTAGRLHTQKNLMAELQKVSRVLGKLDEKAPHEVLLVLDAGTGQNALSQATQFDAAVKVSGIAVTKLDGTAKGGIIFAIAKKMGVPIRFIGVGEAIDDLRPFNAEDFVKALFTEREK